MKIFARISNWRNPYVIKATANYVQVEMVCSFRSFGTGCSYQSHIVEPDMIDSVIAKYNVTNLPIVKIDNR